MRGIRRRDEHAEQVLLFKWAELIAPQHPELELLFAIPNSAKRSWKLAAYMKAEGLKSGLPDVFLPSPKAGQAGLFIELKAAGGKTTIVQDLWLLALAKQGYAVQVCYGAEEAIAAITRYLKGDKVK